MTVPSSTKLTPAAQPTARKRAYNTQAQPAPQAVRQWLPQSVLSRLALAVIVGVLLVQWVGNSIWVYQIRKEVQAATAENTDNLADTLNNTLRYLSKLPSNYRLIALEQLREAGGTRFYISLHERKLQVQPLPDSVLASLVIQRMTDRLNVEWAPKAIEVVLASPIDLVVRDNDTLLTEMPRYVNNQHLILSPKPAPLLVVQLEIEPDVWAYVAALMPDPFFLDSHNPLTIDRLFFQTLTVLTVLLMLMVIVRWITKPMALLANAAGKFGRGDRHEPLPTRGTREYTKLATAFNEMEERLMRYMQDRERLFSSISHDLRTPITRLKLRAELLDNDQTGADFTEDLDELELMVIGALQLVRDSDIHENNADVDINRLILRLIEPMLRAGHPIRFEPGQLATLSAKPLALKRALTNLIDNAIFYGKRADISVTHNEAELQVVIRDYGPGIDGDAERLFKPFSRLNHGREQREDGFGLGLNIAQHLINGHGGSLALANHEERGLVVTVRIPLA